MTKKNEPAVTEQDAEKQKINKLREAHLTNIYDLTSSALAECLGADLKYYEVNYAARRLIQAIEEVLPQLSPVSEEINNGMKIYFRAGIKQLQELLPVGVFTEEREIKCEPVVHSLAKLVGDELFEKDKEWLDGFIASHNKMLLISLVKHYYEALFDKVNFALEHSFSDAEKKLFGVDKSDLSLKMLDEILKRA